jgi:hypothetical protein
MGPKKDNDSSKVKRKNTNIMIDVKKEITAKHENGVRVSDLGTSCWGGKIDDLYSS